MTDKCTNPLIFSKLEYTFKLVYISKKLVKMIDFTQFCRRSFLTLSLTYIHPFHLVPSSNNFLLSALNDLLAEFLETTHIRARKHKTLING